MSSKTFNKTNSKSTNSKSTIKSKRFECKITVQKKLMGPLIGRGGCNIRRICAKCRFGTFIKGMPDGVTFQISSYSNDAIKTASNMLKMDEAALINPSSRSSKPFQILKIDDIYVRHVVGKDGGGIRSIMDIVGDGCYIVHRDGNFHVTANSNDDVQHAIKLIHRERDAYISWCKGTELESTFSSKQTTNSYAELESDSDDEHSPDEHISNQFPPLNITSNNITLKVSEKTVWDEPLEPTNLEPTNLEPTKITLEPLKPRNLISSWADAADTDSEDETDETMVADTESEDN